MASFFVWETSTLLRVVRAAQSSPQTCATFDLLGNPRQWIQFDGNRINACYPRHAHPRALVFYLGGELDSWQAGLYLTVRLLVTDPACVADWIAGYARAVLEGGPAPIFCASLGRLKTSMPVDVGLGG